MGPSIAVQRPGTQIVFWTFTFPVNQQTSNWTVLPPDRARLRAQWEYSHAASAVLNLIALVALILSAMQTGVAGRTASD